MANRRTAPEAALVGLIPSTLENVRHAHLVTSREAVKRHIERLQQNVCRTDMLLGSCKLEHPLFPRVRLSEPHSKRRASRFFVLVEPTPLACFVCRDGFGQ